MNEIYVGNLPAGIDSPTLEGLFALCGPILSSLVVHYHDHDHKLKRAYGMVTFKNVESVVRASYFNKKAYRDLSIIVNHADKHHYAAYLGGIPSYITIEQITKDFIQSFDDRVNWNIKYKVGTPGYAIINFKDRQSREKYLDTKVPNYLYGTVTIKEPKRDLAPTSQSNEPRVEVAVLNVPTGTLKAELNKMFELCGEIDRVTVLYSENFFTMALMTMSRRAFETATNFDNCEVNGWPTPIRIILKNQLAAVRNEKKQSRCLLLRNFDPTWKLKDFEEKFFAAFGLDSVNLRRDKRDGTVLYVNFKRNEEMKKARMLSGKMYFGGKEPATFEEYQIERRMRRSGSNESIVTLGLLFDNRPDVTCLTRNPDTLTRNRRQWKITVEGVSDRVDFSMMLAAFVKIGNVTDMQTLEDNSFVLQLSPNL